jgi:hypothetical protein
MYEDVVDDVKEKGYVAVSHVWGVQQMYYAAELGVLGGVDWKIPLSDPNKIGRLVDAMNLHEMEYVWFDVLCMPQDKQDEINLEIPLMGDYYSGAEITYVLSDVEYNIHEDLTKWCDIMCDVMEKERNFTSEEYVWIMSHGRGNILDISPDMWFDRVWTYQEAALSNVVIIVDIKGHQLALTGILMGISYMNKMGEFYAAILFSKSASKFTELCDSIFKRQTGTLDLITVGTNRNCYKIQDKFYGVLGMLGYKDFPVSYNINVEDLNRQIIQYAYSKGDLSWIRIGGNNGPNFIQPPNERLTYISGIWKEEEPGICNIVFEDDALCMDVFSLATVIRCREYGKPEEGYVAKFFEILRNWGFDDDCIVRSLTGFVDIPHEVHETIKIALSSLDINGERDEIAEKLNKLSDNGMEYIRQAGVKIAETIPALGKLTITVVTLHEARENIPVIISGNADIGDEIKLLRIYDNFGRSLGIVCNSGKRKGICVYKKIDVPECSYASYKFTL